MESTESTGEEALMGEWRALEEWRALGERRALENGEHALYNQRASELSPCSCQLRFISERAKRASSVTVNVPLKL